MLAGLCWCLCRPASLAASCLSLIASFSPELTLPGTLLHPCTTPPLLHCYTPPTTVLHCYTPAPLHCCTTHYTDTPLSLAISTATQTYNLHICDRQSVIASLNFTQTYNLRQSVIASLNFSIDICILQRAICVLQCAICVLQRAVCIFQV